MRVSQTWPQKARKRDNRLKEDEQKEVMYGGVVMYSFSAKSVSLISYFSSMASIFSCCVAARSVGVSLSHRSALMVSQVQKISCMSKWLQ